jgi:hypothetical protein
MKESEKAEFVPLAPFSPGREAGDFVRNDLPEIAHPPAPDIGIVGGMHVVPSIRIYAGQSDQNDPAHFTIRYEESGRKYIVDGFIEDAESPRNPNTPDGWVAHLRLQQAAVGVSCLSHLDRRICVSRWPRFPAAWVHASGARLNVG